MLLGNYATDCETEECKILECFVPCDHRKEVYELVQYIPSSGQAFLRDLLEAFLQDHENLLERACAELPIEEQGARLGLNPMQCAVSDYVKTGDAKICDLCNCPCVYSVEPSGNKQWFNFAETYPDIYAQLVSLLKCSANYTAGGLAISDFIAAFGGELEGLSSGVYTISLPNDPNILSIISLIDSLVPYPAGLSGQFIIKDCS